MSVDELFEAIKDVCLPGLWSKGVALARTGAVIEDRLADDEIQVRVQTKDRPVSPRVTLWPNDEDWYCDCGDRTETCAHVAAAVIAIKVGQLVRRAGQDETLEKGAPSEAPFVRYKFSREGSALAIERVVVSEGKERLLAESLVGLVGGISSGRVQMRTMLTTKEDFAADSILTGRNRRGALDASVLRSLLNVLKDSSNLVLGDKLVRASALAVGHRARVIDDGDGFRVEVGCDAPAIEIFSNGVALVGDTIKPFEAVSFKTRRFARTEVAELVGEVLPELRQKIAVEVATERLPSAVKAEPRAVIRLDQAGDQALIAVARIVYGDPAIAELDSGKLVSLSSSAVPVRDQGAEWNLTRKLQNELHLMPGRMARLEGEAAVAFRLSLNGWTVEGGGAKSFEAGAPLRARFDFVDGRLNLRFESEGRGEADPERVVRAWRENLGFVPLLGGGYAPLPKDWFSRYGERIEALLSARDSRGALPRYLAPEAAALCEGTGASGSDALTGLRRALEVFEGIPRVELPKDLSAELRAYQRAGVDWLAFLRENEMGALLADDMGLGKTLQALCSVRGRTLVVAPTSVLYGWAEQLRRFRPSLKSSIYHGGSRTLDPTANVTLTTYSILRLDREALTAIDWDTAILDEAQAIKNPESQAARAAHALRAKFRVALTGTPVENRLDDLWSQFQFLNPGLLGSREFFSETLARDPKSLRVRIKPFLLRRLKRDVAPELPLRTETVLHCELSDTERELYDAVLASTRKEVLAQLERGEKGSVMRALEALLRLRQACCHSGLLPGQAAHAIPSSSKVDLLLESLEESIGLGHRALVFSQWTSLLDLIEPKLSQAGIAFERLDGSTSNRAEVVARFQDPKGAPVMLISLKAGGVGLTLTAADHIFLMDPWWNPAVEDQAADRAHRIGQENPVLIQRLVARETVEERILELQKVKKELAGSVLEEAGAAASLTRDDLLALLS